MARKIRSAIFGNPFIQLFNFVDEYHLHHSSSKQLYAHFVKNMEKYSNPGQKDT